MFCARFQVLMVNRAGKGAGLSLYDTRVNTQFDRFSLRVQAIEPEVIRCSLLACRFGQVMLNGDGEAEES
jgi:hypothetical protein